MDVLYPIQFQLDALQKGLGDLLSNNLISFVWKATDIQRDDDKPFIVISINGGEIVSCDPEQEETEDSDYPGTLAYIQRYRLFMSFEVRSRVVNTFQVLDTLLQLHSVLKSDILIRLLDEVGCSITDLTEDEGEPGFTVEYEDYQNRVEAVASLSTVLSVVNQYSSPQYDINWIEKVIASTNFDLLPSELNLDNEELP